MMTKLNTNAAIQGKILVVQNDRKKSLSPGIIIKQYQYYNVAKEAILPSSESF